MDSFLPPAGCRSWLAKSRLCSSCPEATCRLPAQVACKFHPAAELVGYTCILAGEALMVLGVNLWVLEKGSRRAQKSFDDMIQWMSHSTTDTLLCLCCRHPTLSVTSKRRGSVEHPGQCVEGFHNLRLTPKSVRRRRNQVLVLFLFLCWFLFLFLLPFSFSSFFSCLFLWMRRKQKHK